MERNSKRLLWLAIIALFLLKQITRAAAEETRELTARILWGDIDGPEYIRTFGEAFADGELMESAFIQQLLLP